MNLGIALRAAALGDDSRPVPRPGLLSPMGQLNTEYSTELVILDEADRL
jgi:hypothetical protein